jgi:hypothetical protein
MLLGIAGGDHWKREVQALPDYVRVAPKEESRLAAFLGWLQPWSRKSWARRAITLGFTVYMPEAQIGSDEAAPTVAHEGKHATDAKKLTRVVFALAYLFPPALITFRALLEVRGFEAEARAMVRLYGASGAYEKWARGIGDTFAGASYFFMAPWGRGWVFKRLMAAVVDELRRRGEWGAYVEANRQAVQGD